jgi:anti-anti-sigma factor
LVGLVATKVYSGTGADIVMESITLIDRVLSAIVRFHQPSYKIADGEGISDRGANWFTRSFGAGYPDLDRVVKQLREARCELRSAVGTRSRVAQVGQVLSALAKGDGGAMVRDRSFHYELEKSKDKNGNQATTIKCHGELVSDTAGQVKELVRPLILLGGRIIIDLGDVKHLDSAGLGALVGLKVSAIEQGLCILELANMTPGVLELLRITHLTQMFSS